RGVQFAASEAVREGRAVGGRPIVFVHVDDRGDADTVQAETVRLLTVNQVTGLLAGPDAFLAQRLVRTAQPYAAAPHSLAAVVVPGELLDSSSGEPVLSLGAPADERGRVLAQQAAREVPASRAAVLTDSRQPATTRLANAFLEEWRRQPKAQAL